MDPKKQTPVGRAIGVLIRAALQPKLTVPALICALRWPDRVNAAISAVLRRARSDTAQRLRKPLLWLAVIGSVVRMNRFLSHQWANNWVSDNSYDWTKEVVVVTGGASGLGLAMVRNFASRGIRVVGLDLQDAPADYPQRALFEKCDVTDWKQVTEAAESIRFLVGDPTILINNAGLTCGGLLLPESAQRSQDAAVARLQRFERVFNVNCCAHYRMILALVPSMIARNHGHIVTVASGQAFGGNSPSCEYSASKAAAGNIHDALGMELRNTHHAPKVRTTIYYPSYIRTPFVAEKLAKGLIAESLLLEPDLLAAEIVRQVLSGESGGQIMHNTALFAGMRGWPLWLQIWFKEKMFGKVIPRSADAHVPA